MVAVVAVVTVVAVVVVLALPEGAPLLATSGARSSLVEVAASALFVRVAASSLSSATTETAVVGAGMMVRKT